LRIAWAVVRSCVKEKIVIYAVKSFNYYEYSYLKVYLFLKILLNFFLLAVLGVELRAWYLLGRCSTA
jgi:hypothetical protein